MHTHYTTLALIISSYLIEMWKNERAREKDGKRVKEWEREKKCGYENMKNAIIMRQKIWWLYNNNAICIYGRINEFSALFYSSIVLISISLCTKLLTHNWNTRNDRDANVVFIGFDIQRRIWLGMWNVGWKGYTKSIPNTRSDCNNLTMNYAPCK